MAAALLGLKMYQVDYDGLLWFERAVQLGLLVIVGGAVYVVALVLTGFRPRDLKSP